MPNWCEGTLKVRGTLENVRRFMEEGIDYGPNRHVNVIEYGDEEIEFNIPCEDWSWIKGTDRYFINNDLNAYVYEGGTLCLHFKAAWYINAEDLQTVCQEYGVNMKIQAFEMGMQFSQIVEIMGGEIVKNESIEYDDWDWDCPCPTLGG